MKTFILVILGLDLLYIAVMYHHSKHREVA